MTFHDPFPIKSDTFRGLGNVSGPSSGIIGDAFVDADLSAGGPGSYIGLAVTDLKRGLFFATLGLLITIVIARAAQVQVADYDTYADQAESNRMRIVRVPTERGIIYDRKGRPLVRNVPSFAAIVVPADLPTDPLERSRVLVRIAGIVGVEADEIELRMGEFDRYRTSELVVKEDLTHDQAVLAAVESSSLPGFRLRSTLRREYLEVSEASSLAHVIGYEGRITQADLDADRARIYAPSDSVGKTGLERQYETELRGEIGKRRVEVDALGREKSVISETAGEPGRNLILSLDLDLQRAADQALRDELRLIGRKRGSAIAMDPRTGRILALVSLPAFDANLFSGGIATDDYRALADDPNHPLFPRAIGATLASGSVFKPVVGAAAIEEGIVTPETSFLSTGGLHVGQWSFPDWKAGGHGVTNLAKAIAESVNTYFYIVGGGYDGRVGLGAERIAAYARKFGFGSLTGIDLPGEGTGFVPSVDWKEQNKGEKWYVGDTYHFAIGQGDLLVTPLQINVMTAAIANGGRLVSPRVASAFATAAGEREEIPPVTLAGQVVSSKAMNAVRTGMRQAVTAGSARSLGDLPVAAAAKTGTAQWSSTKSTHAWFTSFAPYDAPEIAVTVMIEEGGEGSSAAAPVAKAILREYFAKDHQP